MRPARWLLAGAGALVLAAGVVAEAAPASMLDLAIEVARRDHPHIDEGSVRKRIAALAAHYRRRAGPSASAAKKIESLVAVLFDDERLRVEPELRNASALHIDSVLAARAGYCLSLSVIALCLAEDVGLPLRGVVIPNHFFVRYDDGTVRRNLELTRRGAALDDDAMRRALKLPKDSLYLRSLDRRGVHACLLHNRGYVAMLAGRKDLARGDLRRALEMAPGLGEAHRNLGVLQGEAKRWNDASKRFAAAVRLYPADWDAWAGLAVCCERQDDRAGARKAWTTVLSGRPSDKRAVAALARLVEPPAGHRFGLRGRYYAGTDHKTLLHERIDETIDFDWKNAAPAPKVPRDGFSVRWDGWFVAGKAGLYTFFIVANDGFRLRIGDTLLLDDWRDRRYENAFESAEVRLEPGLHKIRIEHADFRGGARLMLRVGFEGERDPIPHARCLIHRVRKR